MGTDTTYSEKGDPFQGLRSAEDIERIVDRIMKVPAQGQYQKVIVDPFWDKAERALLMAGASYLCGVAAPELRSFGPMLWMMQQEGVSVDAAKPDGSAGQKPGFLEMLFAGDVKIAAGTADGSLEAIGVADAGEKAALKAKINASPCMGYYQEYAANAGKTRKIIQVSALVRLNAFGAAGLRQ